MKKSLLLVLLLLPVLAFGLTRPDWLQIANAPALDIRAFGCSTSSTDNSAGLRLAIASATAQQADLVVVGMYKIASSVVIDGASIRGVGGPVDVTNIASGGSGFIISSNTPLFTATGTAGFSLDGLKLMVDPALTATYTRGVIEYSGQSSGAEVFGKAANRIANCFILGRNISNTGPGTVNDYLATASCGIWYTIADGKHATMDQITGNTIQHFHTGIKFDISQGTDKHTWITAIQFTRNIIIRCAQMFETVDSGFTGTKACRITNNVMQCFTGESICPGHFNASANMYSQFTLGNYSCPNVIEYNDFEDHGTIATNSTYPIVQYLDQSNYIGNEIRYGTTNWPHGIEKYTFYPTAAPFESSIHFSGWTAPTTGATGPVVTQAVDYAQLRTQTVGDVATIVGGAQGLYFWNYRNDYTPWGSSAIQLEFDLTDACNNATSVVFEGGLYSGTGISKGWSVATHTVRGLSINLGVATYTPVLATITPNYPVHLVMTSNGASCYWQVLGGGANGASIGYTDSSYAGIIASAPFLYFGNAAHAAFNVNDFIISNVKFRSQKVR